MLIFTSIVTTHAPVGLDANAYVVVHDALDATRGSCSSNSGPQQGDAIVVERAETQPCAPGGRSVSLLRSDGTERTCRTCIDERDEPSCAGSFGSAIVLGVLCLIICCRTPCSGSACSRSLGQALSPRLSGTSPVKPSPARAR